jgi:hypothetical protein
MSFPAKGKTDTINCNAYITISNIPDKACQYIVNGKSAIEWVMERYAVTTHKESGVKNDPNDWAIEHNNPPFADSAITAANSRMYKSAGQAILTHYKIKKITPLMIFWK